MSTTRTRSREPQLLRFSEVRGLLRGRGLGIRMVQAMIRERRLQPVPGLPVQHARYRREDVQRLAAGAVLSRGQVFHLLRVCGLGAAARHTHGRPAVFDEWRASGLLVPAAGLPGTRARYSLATLRTLIRNHNAAFRHE